MRTVHNIFIKINKITTPYDNEAYRCLLNDISNQLNYTVINTLYHEFKPHGLTGVLLLSESHISIHTWPEDEYAILEMVTCKPFSSSQCKIISDTIKRRLKTEAFDIQINV